MYKKYMIIADVPSECLKNKFLYVSPSPQKKKDIHDDLISFNSISSGYFVWSDRVSEYGQFCQERT